MKPGAGLIRSKSSMGDSAAGPLESEWIERARRGDAEAFRVLVDRHRDRAYGLALRIVRSPADAEEVTQDAFVRAWLALPGFRGEARFSTWLHRIVVRRALDRAEVLARRRAREETVEAIEDRPALPETGRADTEEARVLERLIARLPEKQQVVVTLFYHQDRSIEQVAETLGLPTGTVKTHLSRARAALR